MIYAFLALILAGCSTLIAMDCAPMIAPKEANIVWTPTTDPQGDCAKLGATTFAEGGCIYCASHNGKKECHIVMLEPALARDDVAGHELRHAFGCKHQG